MATPTTHPYLSGWCSSGSTQHERCSGGYGGVTCHCPHHDEPAPELRDDSELTIVSEFSGYGGLDLAVQQVLGGRVIAHVEYEPPTKANPNPRQAAAQILAHRFPGIPNLGDISKVDWSALGRVDVVIGGFPCQDVSCAGLRAGLRPDTRSGLWAQMRYSIAQLRPSLVVIENVRGLLSAAAHGELEPCPWCVGDDEGVALRALGAVLGDLAELGYDASWTGLRAADVGAPHGRFRVFIVAWPAADTGRDGRDGDQERHGRTLSGLTAPLGDDADGRPGSDAWGPYAAAVGRWEQLTRPAPAPTEEGSKGQPRLSPAFVEWLMGLPAGWVTEVPGLSRNDQLKALGNGVVPQQAVAALQLLLADVPGLVAA